MISRIEDLDGFIDAIIRLDVGVIFGVSRLAGTEPLHGWFQVTDGLWFEGDDLYRERIKDVLGDG